MKNFDFKSIVVGSEINLNQISNHFGINKKFKWEEPLILNEKSLKGIILHPEDKFAYVYHFGSIVCVNLTTHEIKDIVGYLKKLDNNLKNNMSLNFVDDFKVVVDKNSEFELNYNFIVLNEIEEHQLDITTTILAKSAALKKIEEDIDILLDEIERVIIFLDKGKLNLSDEQLAKTSAKILRFKYNTLSYIMLLEKPDIAWKNEELEDFFTHLSELFELKDRYEKIRHKTEVLLDITEVFSSLTHSKRGTRLEWAVIILILIEIIMSVAEKLVKVI